MVEKERCRMLPDERRIDVPVAQVPNPTEGTSRIEPCAAFIGNEEERDIADRA